MGHIRFSHDYPKLYGQKWGLLVWISVWDSKDVNKNRKLLEYDTRYIREVSPTHTKAEYYPLPNEGKLLQLIFLGDEGIPFCTFRPYTDKKHQYYTERLGTDFDIKISESDK
jgi:hypothetical protein